MGNTKPPFQNLRNSFQESPTDAHSNKLELWGTHLHQHEEQIHPLDEHRTWLSIVTTPLMAGTDPAEGCPHKTTTSSSLLAAPSPHLTAECPRHSRSTSPAPWPCCTSPSSPGATRETQPHCSFGAAGDISGLGVFIAKFKASNMSLRK